MPPYNPHYFEQQAANLASQAIEFDTQRWYDLALYSYNEAIQCLFDARSSGSTLPSLGSKIEEYIRRAEELKAINSQNEEDRREEMKKSSQSDDTRSAERARFLLEQALDEDEQGNAEEAIELYSEAVELCLESRKSVTNNALKERLKKIAENSLNRAETLQETKRFARGCWG